MIIIHIINGILVPVIFAVAFIVFIWGIAQTYIISRGDEAGIEKGHKLILWGLIGFFVMISVWGLVNVVVDTFGLNAPVNRSIPTFLNTSGSSNTNSGVPAARTPAPAPANTAPAFPSIST